MTLQLNSITLSLLCLCFVMALIIGGTIASILRQEKVPVDLEPDEEIEDEEVSEDE